MSNKNPNSGINRMKRGLFARWAAEDYPGAAPRFHWQLLSKDIAVFILLPIVAIIVYRSMDGIHKGPKRPNPAKMQNPKDQLHSDSGKSQIIDFGSNRKGGGGGVGIAGVSKRAPGTLVRLKLQNVVETYSTAPVHAQIVDSGLGRALMGGSLIGDATPDTTFDRINITFRFARDSSHEGVALGVAARALSLDGTLGLVASKKEGFVTRSAIGSANTSAQGLNGGSTSPDLKDILFRALTTGLFQEIGSGTQVMQNRAQVLTLEPATEFFAELTDFFPGKNQ
jgi:hypothetical protein